MKHCGESKFDTQAAEGVGLDAGGPIRVILPRTNYRVIFGRTNRLDFAGGVRVDRWIGFRGFVNRSRVKMCNNGVRGGDRQTNLG